MRTVITYGTFDLFHKGHYNILKRAKEEGDYLIVGVTGETYDEERGKLSVQDSLATRIENVKQTGFADKVIVEEYLGQKISDIIKYNVDVFVIGSDWKGKFDHLSKYCEVRYLDRTKNISSTLLREETLKTYRFGIVTDNIIDNDSVMEAARVSGIHPECVYSQDINIAQRFCNIYELNDAFSDYDAFLDNSEIVFIKTSFSQRKELIEKALQNGKHVIYNPPCTFDIEEKQHLIKLAEDNQLVLMENVPVIYLQAFSQLLWMARGNLIGDLINVRCSVSKSLFDEQGDYPFDDIAYTAICVITKILGVDFEKINCKLINDEENELSYALIDFFYDNSVASIEVSMASDIESGISIHGTKGDIKVPEDWWRIGYFKMKAYSDKHHKHYSSNFDGNGFRYIVQDLLQRVKRDNMGDVTRISSDESDAIISVLNCMYL